MRSTLAMMTLGLLGCASLPHAQLLLGQGPTLEVLAGPAVCGPVGFRKVPLQSRWGEYVRVTVAGPAVLRGTVLVHANGVAQEPRSWTNASGPLVIDARFPNEDVDARFALVRERPIDLTLTGLEGTCEGAVFTVEQGELVPSVDERAWLAELVRRGGPELAVRRELARVEAEARRQAHFAQWEARQQVEVSVEARAQAQLLRQAHYALWDARHLEGVTAQGALVSAPLNECERGACGRPGSVTVETSLASAPVTVCEGACGVGGSVAFEGWLASTSTTAGVGGTCPVSPVAGVPASGCAAASAGLSDASPRSPANACSGETCGAVAFEDRAGVSGPEAVGASGVAFERPSGGALASGCSSGTCSASGAVEFQNAVAPMPTAACSSGACGASGAVAYERTAASVSAVGCSSGTCGVSAAVDLGNPLIPGSLLFEGALRPEGCVSSPADFVAFPAPLQPTAQVTLPTSTDEWSPLPETGVRAQASVESTWVQPYQPPTLEPVAVSTEVRVVNSAPPPCANCESPALDFFVPALFNAMFQLAVPAAQAPVHGAEPVSPRPR